jgi:hypothetical protein
VKCTGTDGQLGQPENRERKKKVMTRAALLCLCAPSARQISGGNLSDEDQISDDALAKN